MKLYLNFDRALSAVETDALRELVKRRGQREPLQHITGSTSFCGHEIAVNRHVLVPRPETELLAELGRDFLVSAKLAASNGIGFLHGKRLHCDRACGTKSGGQNHGDGHFAGRAGVGAGECATERDGRTDQVFRG